MERTACTAVIVVLVGALLAGCPPGTDTIVLDASLTTDAFPGGTVQSNNVADDQRALSINGQSFDAGSLQVVRNGATGQAIAVWTTVGGTHLWATHFDGTGFTPPVELLGSDIDPAAPVDWLDGDDDGVVGAGEVVQGRIIIAFLNTSTFSVSASATENQTVRARDGDAVILWTRQDATQPGSANGDAPGRNAQLYYSYFDRTCRDDPFEIATVRGAIAEVVQHGFTETASLVSNGTTIAGGEGREGSDPVAENVRNYGVASDGLVGSASWGFDAASVYAWGDAVTHVVAFFFQREDADDGTGDADAIESNTVNRVAGDDAPNDFRLFAAIMNLQTATFGNASEAASAGFVGLGGVENGVGGSHDRDENLVPGNFGLFSHNNTFINFYVDVDISGGLAADVPIAATTAIATATGATLDTAEISPAHTATGAAGLGDVSEQVFGLARTNVHGTDEGLQEIFVFYGHVTFTDLAAGNVDDLDVFVSRVPAAATGFAEAEDIEQISDDENDLNNGGDAFSIQTAVDRTGTWIGANWFGTANDTADGAGASPNDIALFGSIVRDGTAPFARGVAGGLVHSPQYLSTHSGDTDDVLDGSFQARLGFLSGIQSDPTRMNILLSQDDDGDGTDNEVLLAAQLVLGADADADCAPDGPLPIDSSFSNNELLGLGFGGEGNAGADGIDAGANGEVFVVWTRDTVAAVTTEGNRLFAAEVDVDNGIVDGTTDVGSDVDTRDADPGAFVFLGASPAPTAVANGATNAFGAQRIDMVFTEERRDAGLNSIALVHRAYDATKAGSTAVPFASRFSPSLADRPFEVDTHEHTNAAPFAVLYAGSTLGLFFTQDGHTYYNEFSGSAWTTENGDIEPQLIDNDTGENATAVLVSTGNRSSADALTNAITFWTIAERDGDVRLKARVRN